MDRSGVEVGNVMLGLTLGKGSMAKPAGKGSTATSVGKGSATWKKAPENWSIAANTSSSKQSSGLPHHSPTPNHKSMGHHVGAKKKALDIFTGSGSVADALRKEGYEVFTLDIDPRSKANFTIKVLEWQVEKLFKPGFFHLVAASPPCTDYSSCMTRRPREMEKADLLVQRTIDIIAYLKPPHVVDRKSEAWEALFPGCSGWFAFC